MLVTHQPIAYGRARTFELGSSGWMIRRKPAPNIRNCAAVIGFQLDLSVDGVGETAVQQDPQPSLLRCIGLAARRAEVNSLGRRGPRV